MQAHTTCTFLVEPAVLAGTELRKLFEVQEPTEGDQVTGIRGHDVGGAIVAEQARIVIGANSLRSLDAERAGAKL